jgi:16S rRNA (guanine1207-N2)-methyltransferase
MIELMLEDASLKVVGLDLDGVAVEIQPAKQHLTRSYDWPVKSGHAQTALLKFPLPGALHDLGVEQDPAAFVAVEHEDPAADANLWSGKPHAGRVVHHLEHVVDQPDQISVDLGDITGTLPQHRVAYHPYVVGNHDDKGSVAPMSERTPESHYFSDHRNNPAPRSAPKRLEVVVDGRSLELASDTGVFSHGHLDDGTSLLIERGATPPTDATDLLDLGCGYGPVALALGLRAPSARIWAVDTNPRAVELCAANAAANDIANVHAIVVDADPALGGLDPNLRFDALWSNPPVRIGKPALHRLLLTAIGRLGPGGSGHLVVHKHLGSDSLQTWLTSQGHPTTRRLSRMGFRLLDVEAVA